MSFGTRLIIAIGIEASWEVIENTSWLIDRYRGTTVSLDYYGDSVINSVSDTLAMVLGFVFASRARVPAVIGVAMLFELFTGYMIHDNLTLNIAQLIRPIPAISAWQSQIK